MPNWCYNVVTFQGEHLSVLQVQELIEVMANREEKEQHGQLPDGSIINEGYFFDICWGECDILTYQTKYRPNIEVLVEIAQKYGCDFECQYEELNGGSYGIATYVGSVLKNIYLETEDFAKLSYDEFTDRYLFEDEAYESDLDILEILLMRKIDSNIKSELQ